MQRWLNIIAAANQTADLYPDRHPCRNLCPCWESYQLTAGLQTLGMDADMGKACVWLRRGFARMWRHKLHGKSLHL